MVCGARHSETQRTTPLDTTIVKADHSFSWMDLKNIQQRLRPENPKVGYKAAELLRLAAVKVPSGTLRNVSFRAGHLSEELFTL